MKYFTLLIVALCFSMGAHSQLIMSAQTKVGWQKLSTLAKKEIEPTAEEYSGCPVHRIHNELYVSLMGKLKASPDWESLSAYGVIRGSITGNIATLKVPLRQFNSVPLENIFSYVELPSKIVPQLDKAVSSMHADSVQQGINLPQEYTGENVIIGVTDWGFDYTHPMFYDTLLQHTRIIAAWDQYKQSGNAPQYGYGAAYYGEDELLEAKCDTASIYSFHTHATHVAGIAGGSGAGTIYRGMAPSAQFLFTDFLVDAASVIDAFNWMADIAEQEDKRLVVNMSWGLYHLGTLDGNSLVSQVIDALSEEGVVFVSSAGNNGDVNFHIKKTFDNNYMTTRIRFDDYSTPHYWGQSVTMWGEAEHSFETKIGVYSNGNVLLAESPFYYTATSDAYTVDTLVTSANDSIFYNVTVDAAHPLNQRPHIRLRVKCTNTNLRIGLTAQAESGTVHFWNLAELTNEVGNWGLPLSGFGSAAASGDSKYSIGEPTTAASVIAVGAYYSDYLLNGIHNGGQVASFSSFGPLITEVMKPDISAPGVNVISAISSYTDAAYSAVHSIEFNGRTYDFGKMSGTSMSSPCTAGAVALLLEADPTLTSQEIKNILHQTARQDNFTGVIEAPGHAQWGYGKVNIYKAVKSVTPPMKVEALPAVDELILMPNPAQDYFQITLENGDKIVQASAFGMDGRASELDFSGNQINCAELASGLYIIQVITRDNRYSSRFVKR